MNKWLNFLIDSFVIVTQISFNISIIPYFIYGDISPFGLSLLLNAVLSFILMLIRFRGNIVFNKKIFKSGPIIAIAILLFLQFISGLIKNDESSFFIALIIFINFFVFLIYLTTFFEFNLKKYKNNFHKAFFKTTSLYLYFAWFNILLVIVSGLLQLLGVIPSLTNEINGMFTELLKSNVNSGTMYYMPGWISIQLLNYRVGDLAVLTGWTHEPHVFGYLVFPSLFISLAKFKKKKQQIFILISYLIALIFSFSVMVFLVLFLVFFIKLIIDKNMFLVFGILLVVLIVSIFGLESSVINDMIYQTSLKLFGNTSSADYSANKLVSILLPETVFGDGVMLIGNSNNKNAGIFSALFYLIFYTSVCVHLFKILYSKNKQNTYIGLAFLYFVLHGLKLTSSVFAMPYTLFFIGLMIVFREYYKKLTS